MLKDTEIEKYFKIPVQSLQNFKKTDRDNWRKIVYEFLKIQDKERVEMFLKLIEIDEKK